MKVGWFVAIASAFYIFVVALFWPIERQILPSSGPTTDRNGYQHRVVQFSDSHVFARVPTTESLKELGLGGVSTLADDEGMLWVFTTPQRATFWMKGMLIPLDFIWIENNRIVNLTAQAAPPIDPISTDLPILDSGVPVDAVLEVAGGYIERHTLNIGDLVDIGG